MSYYYDLKNDGELTVEDICNKYGITLASSNDTSADKIYAVMPNSSGNFDVYYKQNSSCSSIGCQDMYTFIK